MLDYLLGMTTDYQVIKYILDKNKEFGLTLYLAAVDEINFIDKLRDEIRFHNTDELKVQIAQDVATAKALLEKQILQT